MNYHTQKRNMLFSLFEKCVKKEFSFLDDMLYSIEKNAMGWTITYSSEIVAINICYERTSFEIYMTFLTASGLKCTLDELVDENNKRKFFYITNENTIEEAVIEFKTLFLQYGKAILIGDFKTIENAVKIRDELRKNYSKKQNLLATEAEVALAWKQRQYSMVIELYKSIEEDLTPVQKKRLIISQRLIEGTKDDSSSS